MKNILKKVSNMILIAVIVLPGLIFPSMDVEAASKTLGDYRKELADWEAQQNENKQKQQLTKDQINQIATSITTNTNTINQLSNDMVTLQNEIVQAEKDIEAKNQEIKELVSFLQVAEGESAYLEFAFGAKDFTDFIYRMAISEQLSSYNEDLMKQYNNLIESNKKKKIEITEKQETLKKKQNELATQKVKLGDELQATSAASVSIEEEIKMIRNQIQYLEKLKCRENESVDQCVNRNQVLPAGTAFFRPVVSGKITSEFGNRCYWLNGYRCDFHGGLDMAQSGSAVPVYAAAPGIVVGHTDRGKCGGNMVYIIHNINGKKYTSMYAHLRSIMVRDKQVVTMDTQIGTMGGNPAIETWDGCSSGQHTHFTLANGHYLVDYMFWSQFEAHMFNPRVLVNAPRLGGSFSGRNRKY